MPRLKSSPKKVPNHYPPKEKVFRGVISSTFFGDLSQYFSVEFLSSLAGSPYGIAVAGTTVAVGTAAVATPSSLGLIGGLGFPNPGFTLAGGGVLPTAILVVCKYYH